ncbi:MAG: hypothetical protein JWR75_572 [Devosia sp.]|nr:hypothetical protein [Devosia sp.]
MSNAKPQSELQPADDLIAELARLMAEDAGTDQVTTAPAAAPVETSPPTPAIAPMRSIRLPSAELTPTPVATPHGDLDFGVRQGGPAARADLADFDFGFSQPEPTPTPEPTPVEFHAAPATVPVAVAPGPIQQPAVISGPSAPEHDVIAELIAAEFAAQAADADAEQSAAAPAAAAPAPTPIPPVDFSRRAPAAAATARVQLANANPRSPEGTNAPVIRPVNFQARTAPTPVATAPQPAAAAPQPVVAAPRPTPTLVATPRADEVAPERQVRPAEFDRFNTAPVFGLGSSRATPVAADMQRRTEPQFDNSPAEAIAQLAARDPIDEIESLIGEAVRVDMAPKPVRPAPGPVVAPMAATTGRRSLGRKAVAPKSTSADDAILAAAGASGIEVDRVDSDDDQRTRDTYEDERPRRSIRSIVGPAIALFMLVVAGLGLYWVLGSNSGTGGAAAPVLTGDATPVKEAAPVAVADAADQRSAVFDELDGVTVAEGGETLVSRDQSDNVEVAAITPPEAEEATLTQRKVRTVTVRPDGTIISGDDAVAGTEALPVDRPLVPEIAGSSAAADATNLLASVASALANEQGGPASLAAPGAAGGEANAAAAAAFADPATQAPLDPSIPYPHPRPDWYGDGNASLAPPAASPVTAIVDTPPVTLASLAAEVPAATEPVSVPLVDLVAEVPADEIAVATPAPAGTTAAAWVQVASQTSQAEAQASLSVLQQRYGNVFGNAQLEIQRADLGAKGVYYRVRLPANSTVEATQICAQIKGAGGDCAVF